MTRHIIGFRSADDTHEGLHGHVTVSTELPTKRRKSKPQQPIGFHTHETKAADASEPTTLGELSALKELLRRDHAKRKRKQTTLPQEPVWCACGHYGIVDYDVVDRACAALSKLQQGSVSTGASEEPQPKRVRFRGHRAFDLATTAYQIAVTADYVSIQPRGLDELSSVDIPISMVGEVVEALMKAASHG